MLCRSDITLCFICKNGDEQELRTLPKMLASVKGFVDDICATVTLTSASEPLSEEILALFNMHGCKISTFVWTGDFSSARNFNFAQAETELVMWLDSDDILKGAENIGRVKEIFEKAPHINQVWFPYQYDHDVDGNVLSVFPRERIVKKSIHKWIGRLHENCVCKYEPNGIITDMMHVYHNTKHENIEAKAIRNLNIVREAYNHEKRSGKIDPRTVYDMARSYHAICAFKEAEERFREFLGLTQSEQDYYDALLRLIDIYIATKRFQMARDACHQAIKVKYDWPDAYFCLARAAFSEEMWDECLYWLRVVKQHRPPTGGLPVDPSKYTIRSGKMAAHCMFMLNRAEDALKVIREALKVAPSDEGLRAAEETYVQFLNQVTLEKGFLQALEWLKKNEEHEKIPKLLEALPDVVRDIPQFIRLYNQYHPIDGRDRLVIYCHSGYEKWDGDSWKDGIGGSEEAVINMGRELAKLGWKVEVYNECRNPGVYDGVKYEYYSRFDTTQPCDVFIAWRLAHFVPFAPRHKNTVKILWLHDKQEISYFTEAIIDEISKLFVLSAYHRADLPEIPDEKFYITRNGIDPEHFKNKQIERDEHAYIYASSPDRGLEYILNNWERIKKHDPKANLHVFYGFTKVYDKLMENDPGRREFKERMTHLLENLPDVHYHGRVGHEELADWYQRCAWWLYPTDFPEIFCISAIKAQAAGCWPICTDFAALKETVKYGTITAGDIKKPHVQSQWVDSILKAKKEATPEKRKEMSEWAINNFSWETLAKEWHGLFDEMRYAKSGQGKESLLLG